MTVAGIVTGLFVGYFVIDRLQRKSACCALATACSGAAAGMLVLAIDGHLQGWAVTLGFGATLGAMSGFWEICYGILLADVFGLDILGTINGTLSTFGLVGMALGPVVMSLLYEYSGQSFRLPLMILASANVVGAAVMACVPYQSRREREDERRAGLGLSPLGSDDEEVRRLKNVGFPVGTADGFVLKMEICARTRMVTTSRWGFWQRRSSTTAAARRGSNAGWVLQRVGWPPHVSFTTGPYHKSVRIYRKTAVFA